LARRAAALALFFRFLITKSINMKHTLLTLVMFCTVACMQTLLAQDNYKLGVGVRLSNASPTLSNSVSVKYFISDATALEGLVSFGSRFGIGGLFEIHKPFQTISGLQWFYGAGGYVGFEAGDTYLGPTGVIGLDYKFNNIPLNLSLDWKPELDILPAINFVPDAFGFTARFTLR
jgi:hypothetical protein